MILRTDRLLLRYFDLNDAARVAELAGVFEVADTTLSIPHPYEIRMAQDWIQTHQEKRDRNEEIVFAITLKKSGELIGAIGLTLYPSFNRGEMGYWIGKPFWNKGFATEAAQAVLCYGFEELGLNRVFARYFSRNPASGKVLSKIGMVHEGCMRQHILRWDRFEDIEICAMLSSEYSTRKFNTA